MAQRSPRQPMTLIKMDDGREFRAAGEPSVISLLLGRARKFKYDFRFPDGAGKITVIPHAKISPGKCSKV